jgi:hypothetical protein
LFKTSNVTTAKSVTLGSKLDWKNVHTSEPEGFLDIHHLYGEKDGLVYLGNRFSIPRSGVWTLYVGHDGGIRVFVDGNTVLTVPECSNPAVPGRSKVDLSLSKGNHEIVIAFDTASGSGWGLFTCFEIPKKLRGKDKPVFPQVV